MPSTRTPVSLAVLRILCMSRGRSNLLVLNDCRKMFVFTSKLIFLSLLKAVRAMMSCAKNVQVGCSFERSDFTHIASMALFQARISRMSKPPWLLGDLSVSRSTRFFVFPSHMNLRSRFSSLSSMCFGIPWTAVRYCVGPLMTV